MSTQRNDWTLTDEQRREEELLAHRARKSLLEVIADGSTIAAGSRLRDLAAAYALLLYPDHPQGSSVDSTNVTELRPGVADRH